MAHNVPQTTHPNIKVPGGGDAGQQERRHGPVFDVHRIWREQAHSLRHSEGGLIIRVAWLAATRPDPKVVDAEQRQAVHVDSLVGQAQDRVQDSVVDERIVADELHHGVPRVFVRGPGVFLGVQVGQGESGDHSADGVGLCRRDHFCNEPRLGDTCLPAQDILAGD